MTRILFGLSLLLATCLVDGYRVTIVQADSFDTPSILGIDSGNTNTLSDDDDEQLALLDNREALIDFTRAPSPPKQAIGHPAVLPRPYQIRAPPAAYYIL